MVKRNAIPGAGPTVKTPKRATPLDAVPAVIERATLDDHLEVITRAVFQAGLSWAIIAARWDAFRQAFEGFDVAAVAAYGSDDLARLMATDGVIHSARKLSGTFANAATLIALEREFGSIRAYVSSFATYGDVFADAHRRFAFMGNLGCYYWLFRTAHPVPPFETWIAAQAVDHPRMREMVELARSSGVSPERPAM